MSATVQMMKFMSDQINKLVELSKTQAETQLKVLQAQADQFSNSGGQKNWDNVDKFKNLKLFSGETKDWEEFATKFRSQAGANDAKVMGILEMVENEMKEGDLDDLKEANDYSLINTEKFTAEVPQQTSQKLYNILLSITTGEANAVVRRCRGNGMWAWKKLCTTLNPRTLATGIKMISQAGESDQDRAKDQSRCSHRLVGTQLVKARCRIRRSHILEDEGARIIHDAAEGPPGESVGQVCDKLGRSH